jgi:predicted Na+-dependent transporter
MGLIESLLVGAAFGLVIFGPIAAAQAVRRRRPEWLIRQSSRIHWYTSIAMGFSLGYAVACLRQSTLDKWGLLASLTVFLGAVIKMALGYARPKPVTPP